MSIYQHLPGTLDDIGFVSEKGWEKDVLYYFPWVKSKEKPNEQARPYRNRDLAASRDHYLTPEEATAAALALHFGWPAAEVPTFIRILKMHQPKAG